MSLVIVVLKEKNLNRRLVLLQLMTSSWQVDAAAVDDVIVASRNDL